MFIYTDFTQAIVLLVTSIIMTSIGGYFLYMDQYVIDNYKQTMCTITKSELIDTSSNPKRKAQQLVVELDYKLNSWNDQVISTKATYPACFSIEDSCKVGISPFPKDVLSKW